MPIAKLPTLLINQIAAGEVIERPASCVKELVENSLDAGSQRIEVVIEDGGRELIRITDDGGGIAATELPLAITAHATSKLQTVEQLAAITTMGFRGEALASMASISRLRITSRTPDAEAGAVIEAAGNEISPPRPVGCAPGTVIEVRNLFFNTPARRKFMKGASTEFGQIKDTLARTAMAHPATGFKLIHNDRTALDLPPQQTPTQRCLAILGRDLEEAMMPFSSDERDLAIWGLAAQPSLAKSTAKHLYLFINGRPIRDRSIMHAMKEAYRGLIEPNQQPMVVLFIEMDPREVDVNVHPTKHEVRLANAQAVYGQVLAAIRQTLLGSDLTPAARLPQRESFSPPTGTLSFDDLRREDAEQRTEPVRQFVDFFKRMDPNQKGFVYEQVRREMAIHEPDPDPSEPSLNEGIRSSRRDILQVHDSFIVTQDETGLVIIDQHALHERVMFETLLRRIGERGTLESQRLLTPAPFPVDSTAEATIESLTELLEKIGIEVGLIGPGTAAVYAFPTLLFDRGVEPGEFMQDLIERAGTDDFDANAEAALHEVLDMMSCKAAVKAGDAMAPEELSELLKQKDLIERASNCPHGRPTTVRLSLSDLHKYFKRT